MKLDWGIPVYQYIHGIFFSRHRSRLKHTFQGIFKLLLENSKYCSHIHFLTFYRVKDLFLMKKNYRFVFIYLTIFSDKVILKRKTKLNA